MADDTQDLYHEELARQRQEAAREWDEAGATDPAEIDADVEGPRVDDAFEILGMRNDLPPPPNPRAQVHNVAHHVYAKAHVRGIGAVDAVRGSIGPASGPLEFQGKEDFIRGETACLRGCDIVGTVPQAGSKLGAALKRQNQTMGFVKAKTPAGKPMIAHVVKKTKPLDHKSSISNAQMTAKRMQSVAQKVTDAAKKAGAAAKKGILGDAEWLDIVGAALARRAPMVSPAQLKKMASDLAAAAKKLQGSASTHSDFVKKADTKAKQAADKMKKTYGPSGKKGVPVSIAGEELLGEFYEIVGDLVGHEWEDLVGQVSTLDPTTGMPIDPTTGMPIDPTTGMPIDPTTGQPISSGGGGGGTTIDPATGLPISSGGAAGGGSVAASIPGPPDYGLGKPPMLSGNTIIESDGSAWPQAGVDYDQDPFGGDPSQDQQVYGTSLNNIPNGAVYYDPNVMGPLPWQGVGSFTRFFPQKDNSDGKANSGFQWGGGDPSIMDGWYWWFHGATAGTEYKHENAGNVLWVPGTSHDTYEGAQDLATRQKESIRNGWGPLIGNPGIAQTKNLRLDQDKQQWFWYWDDAPLAAQMAAPNGLGAKLKKDQLDYQTQLGAAKANYAQAVAQDQLNAKQAAQMQQQQALEDAQAQHQIELANAQAQAQQPQLQLQAQQQAQQLQSQEAQLENQLEQQQLEAQKQQQQLAFQQGQAETQAYQQWLTSPQPTMGPMDQGGGDAGGGGDSGGDTGYGDVSNSPFADVQDQVPEYADTSAFDQAADEG